MKIYEGLIKRNPENHAYYHGQATARHADSAEQKLELFAKAREQYPRAQAPQRLALDVAGGKITVLSMPPSLFIESDKLAEAIIVFICFLVS